MWLSKTSPKHLTRSTIVSLCTSYTAMELLTIPIPTSKISSKTDNRLSLSLDINHNVGEMLNKNTESPTHNKKKSYKIKV